MRKLLVAVAIAVVLIDVAGASQIASLLGEISIVAPVVTDHNLPGVSEREHAPRHAHMPLFTS